MSNDLATIPDGKVGFVVKEIWRRGGIPARAGAVGLVVGTLVGGPIGAGVGAAVGGAIGLGIHCFGKNNKG